MSRTLEYGSPSVRPAWSLTRVIAWMCVYPLLTAAFVYGTWVVAAVTLGHAPGTYINDPAGINWVTSTMQGIAVLLIIMAVPLTFVHLVVAVSAAIGSVAEGKWDWRRQVWCAITVLAWAGLWGLVRWDPGRVTDWLMD